MTGPLEYSASNMKSKQKDIILEDIGDWNPLEILGTAGKYYIDLAKSDNPGQQFRKDLKDAGVDDILQGVSAVPFIGLPFGLASIGLNLAAGNTRQALIQTVATAGAAVGISAAGAGFAKAAANPRVATAAARIISRVGQRMGNLPSIGPRIAASAQALGRGLATAISDLAESAAENEIVAAAENSKAVAVAVNKLSKSKVAKKISGKDTAANRKDNSLTNELYSNTEDNLREVRTVKISKSSIRKLVKESIKQSGIVLGEAKQGGVTKGGVASGGGLLLYESDLAKLAQGLELEVSPNKFMKENELRFRIRLIGGEKTVASIVKSLNINMAVFDGVLERKTDLGMTEKKQPKAAKFESPGRTIVYTSQGNKAELKIPAKGGEEGMERKTAVEPIIFALDVDNLNLDPPLTDT